MATHANSALDTAEPVRGSEHRGMVLVCLQCFRWYTSSGYAKSVLDMDPAFNGKMDCFLGWFVGDSGRVYRHGDPDVYSDISHESKLG